MRPGDRTATRTRLLWVHAAARTVTGMRTVFSARTGPEGERVAVDLTPDAVATLTWVDGREPTDLTAWLGDLVLLGWEASTEETLADDPAEEVQVAVLALAGVNVHLVDGHGQVWLLDEETARTWVMLGAHQMIVAGVAHEADDVPDDLAALQAT